MSVALNLYYGKRIKYVIETLVLSEVEL